jgi:hypothetical protein
MEFMSVRKLHTRVGDEEGPEVIGSVGHSGSFACFGLISSGILIQVFVQRSPLPLSLVFAVSILGELSYHERWQHPFEGFPLFPRDGRWQRPLVFIFGRDDKVIAAAVGWRCGWWMAGRNDGKIVESTGVERTHA